MLLTILGVGTIGMLVFWPAGRLVEKTVRIQTEHGHRVIDSGYAQRVRYRLAPGLW